MDCGGIVLCGGRSSRMGLPKLALPFGAEQMLQRVVRLLAKAVREIVVVAAPKQDLPDLPAAVRIVRDRREARGPLEGLRAGLSALPEGCEAAYATGCDVPLLVPAFVTRMIDLLGDNAIAVPISGGRPHPLSAAYRRSVLEAIDLLLAADCLRPAFLFELVPTRRVSVAELLDVDPKLATLNNLNSPSEYLESLACVGFAAPADVLAKLGVAAGRPKGEL
jgi:molybdopterin-guanine dinucleotide biosynthesis protein A